MVETVFVSGFLICLAVCLTLKLSRFPTSELDDPRIATRLMLPFHWLWMSIGVGLNALLQVANSTPLLLVLAVE
ncbi:hypothetical protein ACSBR2_037424 [Camellia fascicularis]